MLAELRLLDEVANGLDAVIVRPPWFYGPHQPARQTTFFTMVRKGRFPIVGDGRQRRSMVYVDDLVDGVASRRAGRVPAWSWLVDRRRPAVRDQRDRRRGHATPSPPPGSTSPPANCASRRSSAAPPPPPMRRCSAATATSPQLHVLGELGDDDRLRHLGGAARARLRTERRPRRGDAPQRRVVPGAGDLAVKVAGHGWQRLLRQPARQPPRRVGRAASGSSTSIRRARSQTASN